MSQQTQRQQPSLGALIPTLSARPNPQILYGSAPGLAKSAHNRARAGDPSLAYIEWSSEPGGCALGEQCPHT